MVRKEVIGSIIDTLQSFPWGLTIEEIANNTGYHRNTVSKYIAILEEAGFLIKRQIGKYTLWFIRNIYEYFRESTAEKFLAVLIKHLKNELNADLFETGRNIVKDMLSSLSHKKLNLKKMLRERAGILRYFTGVYIPTVVPGVKFKIHEVTLSNNFLLIEVSGKICNVDLETKKEICEFMRGYIWGLLEFNDISFSDIEKIHENDGGSCKFKIVFDEPIAEIFL